MRHGCRSKRKRRDILRPDSFFGAWQRTVSEIDPYTCKKAAAHIFLIGTPNIQVFTRTLEAVRQIDGYISVKCNAKSGHKLITENSIVILVAIIMSSHSPLIIPIPAPRYGVTAAWF